MTMKIHCLNQISKNGLKHLTDNYELTDKLEDADAVLVRSANMHEMELPEKLEAIARAGAGVNNIPLDKCTERGIVVFNTPGANANGVKELVIAGMLMAARDIHGGIEWVKENKEDANISKDMEKSKKQFAGTEIKGKRLGVIGLGAIGARVANAAVALGMEVLGYDPYISIDAAWSLSRSVQHCVTLGDMLPRCDYLTIHVPYLPTTRHTINEQTLSLCKDGVRVLNFARGELVDNAALLNALDSGKVAHYFCDFPTEELLGVKGVECTPHLGASTP